jgi:hypothetical protein
LASPFGGAVSLIRSWHVLQTNAFSAARKIHSSDLSASQKKHRRRRRGATVSSKGSFWSLTSTKFGPESSRNQGRAEAGVVALDTPASATSIAD